MIYTSEPYYTKILKNGKASYVTLCNIITCPEAMISNSATKKTD